MSLSVVHFIVYFSVRKCRVFICCACELSRWDSEKRLFDSFVFVTCEKNIDNKADFDFERGEKGLNTVALADNLLENGLESP